MTVNPRKRVSYKPSGKLPRATNGRSESDCSRNEMRKSVPLSACRRAEGSVARHLFIFPPDARGCPTSVPVHERTYR
jgi:hypothetical protein